MGRGSVRAAVRYFVSTSRTHLQCILCVRFFSSWGVRIVGQLVSVTVLRRNIREVL